MHTDLTKPDLHGVKPSDLLGDLEVCDAFRRRSMLITQSTTPATTSTTTPQPTTHREDAQRGRSGFRNFEPDIDNTIPSNGQYPVVCKFYFTATKRIR